MAGSDPKIAKKMLQTSRINESEFKPNISTSQFSILSEGNLLNDHTIKAIQAYVIPKEIKDTILDRSKGEMINEVYTHILTYDNWNEYTSEIYLEDGSKIKSIEKENYLWKATIKIIKDIELTTGSFVSMIALKYLIDINDKLWVVDWVNAELTTIENSVSRNIDKSVITYSSKSKANQLPIQAGSDMSHIDSLPVISRTSCMN